MRPLNWTGTFVTHSRDKKQKVFDLHTKIECMAGLAFRHHFFPNACTQRSKTCCKEPKSCSPEQWKALHINGLIQSFGSVHGKQIYTSFILQRGDFLHFSKRRFKLWKHLKKAWICDAAPLLGASWQLALLWVCQLAWALSSVGGCGFEISLLCCHGKMKKKKKKLVKWAVIKNVFGQ